MASFQFEPSGKLKLPSDAELAEADVDTAVLAYSSGLMENGRPYWAFIAVKPSLYRKFRALSAAKKQLVLQDYGEVLAAGYGKEAPEDVVKQMERDYGYDPGYKDRIAADIRKEQDAFMEKREEERIMDIVAMLKKKQN